MTPKRRSKSDESATVSPKLIVTPTEWIGKSGTTYTIQILTPSAHIDPDEVFYPAHQNVPLKTSDTFEIEVTAGLNRVHWLWDPKTLPPTQETFVVNQIDPATGKTIQPLTNPDIVTAGWSHWVFGQ